MAKLWQKNYDLDKDVEKFTVGDDYLLDMVLAPSDVVGSAAHASMLAKAGILSDEERNQLIEGLNNVLDAFYGGEFRIDRSQEDVHTAVENHLTEHLGDAGKKLHTCRSRNDQVIVDQRLYSKAFLLRFKVDALSLAKALHALAERHIFTPMVGRTHMQKAMPSTVGLWAGSWLESLLDNLGLLEAALELVDQCPLGSAASYGVPVEIDREYTSDLLGFARPLKNVLYANNSRGKFELAVLRALEEFVLDYSRLAQDLILFSMPEFGYFTLPDEMTSGSSIMPQKKNPCGLELIRAKTSTFLSCGAQIAGILKALPSGYNRDLQETKRPWLLGMHLAGAMTRLTALSVSKLRVNEDRLTAAFTPEVFATDEALRLVLSGKPFRDAYKEVGLTLDKLEEMDPAEVVKGRKHLGTAGDLRLDEAGNKIEKIARETGAQAGKFARAIESLMGREVDLLAAGLPYPV